MKISGAIFDMDGTLLDSMWIYKNYATRYLLSRGVTPRDDLEAAVEKLTLEESAAYLSATYALSGGAARVGRELAEAGMALYAILVTIGNLVDPPATMINAAGDYVVTFIVERVVSGKDWLEKHLASKK